MAIVNREQRMANNILKKIDMSQSAWQEIIGKISKVEAKELNRILDKLRS